MNGFLESLPHKVMRLQERIRELEAKLDAALKELEWANKQLDEYMPHVHNISHEVLSHPPEASCSCHCIDCTMGHCEKSSCDNHHPPEVR